MSLTDSEIARNQVELVPESDVLSLAGGSDAGVLIGCCAHLFEN